MFSLDPVKYLGLSISIFKTDPYLNFSIFILIGMLVFSQAKINFLEKQFHHKKLSGLFFAFPTSKWDKTPKLSRLDQEILEHTKKIELDAVSLDHIHLIKIFCASGFDSFVNNPTFEEVLKNHRKSWKILMLNPDSKGAIDRARQYLIPRASDPPDFKSEADYLDGIRKSLESLKRIKTEHNNNINVHLYNDNPYFRYIIAGKLAFIHGFGPGQRSDRSPLLIFENNNTSLFHTFEEMFEDIWANNSLSIF